MAYDLISVPSGIILLMTDGIGRVLILLSIRVEAEFAEERMEDVTTNTFPQLRRSDRGGFPYDIS